MKVQGTLRYSDRLALEVSTASRRKNHTPLLKFSYFQEKMETYERKFQWYGPLTRRILDTSFQAKTKQKLGLQLYIGRKDPIEHLNLFESTMAYRMHTDEDRCLLFPSTLFDGALNWYCRLPPETVDSFEELRKLFVSQHIFQTDCLHSTDDFHEYSRCAEADDKTTFKAFTAGLRDCLFKYMINANTWKTYSDVMTQAYNHTSAEARTYQGNPHMVNPYQQVGSGSQVLPNKEILAIQTPIASSPASFSYSLSHQTKPITTRGIKVRIKTTKGEHTIDYYDFGAKPHSFKVED
ncbi:hypothetical protein ACFX16_031338 [Malus domestica]